MSSLYKFRARLEAYEHRHKVLDKQIQEAYDAYQPNYYVDTLKKYKLKVKDDIELTKKAIELYEQREQNSKNTRS